MRKIGLIDIDSKIGSLALMKISSYHILRGDSIEWAFLLNEKIYDKIYASSLFDFTDKSYLPTRTIKGGPGFGKTTLPDKIEESSPDYSIYPRICFSFQRFSTGCIRKCGFCKVHSYEGELKPVKPMALNPKGIWIYLLDNNFFANTNWNESIKMLLSYNQPIQFEGVDIRILTDEMMAYLNQIKLKTQIHFAWDYPNEAIDKIIEKIIPINKRYRFMAYVLIGYNSTPEQDLFRVERLRNLKIDPFVMPFNKLNKYQKKFARWVNHKAIFKKIKFKDYYG